ncbi:HNH endonuclease [Aquiflexum sp.]|uniref:HNH endonuclease n=1 Tax=Aquiflexum sp. TaxID=1872584 RepID=UPI00359456E3
MYSRSLDLYIEFLDSFSGIPGKVVAPEIERVISDPKLTSTEKQSIILSRRGQGQFRENLVKLWGSCSISGYTDFRLLVASHIKPWSKSDNYERIDKYNGLLILPTYDKLFDLGFIGFNPNGNICVSKELDNPEALNILPNIKIVTHKYHYQYLEYHLEHVFKS